ncbi:MAG: hydantoinase B/oxoprolinase family protein [Alphaproteobacteria bacterium]|nr:hydantoinase B/oxoprolinase family protein [Alphaproteobacteria bacterium]
MNDITRRNTPNPLVDPVTLEVLRNALESTADEMGAVLKRTSFSPNIKERMDASCAVFDASAQLVAQAEHVPVHLGSMLRSVEKTVAAAGGLDGSLDEGDVVIVNDPFTNGSHLPDITVVAPVFAESRHIAYVATRAHHADVGGMEPGSMPGNSHEIYQEGLVIPAVKLYRRGELQDDVMRLILANVRTPEERRGDLNAQLASLRIGERRIRELAQRYGADLVTAGFEAILDYTERRMRRRLAEFPPGTYRGEDFLDDDGSSDEPVRIALAIAVTPQKLVLDFAGSSPQRPGNINAVAPMTYSASFFAIKVLTDPEIPVNAGTFRNLELKIPEGSVLAARHPAATCAGNTETTQRIADTVLKVCAQFAPDRVPAASQGTMNTIAVGGTDPRAKEIPGGRPYSYIETIGGGQGGRPMGPGDDGIQCNMTNTMNTPVEALEITYPLRVERYELREGSAGGGKHRGGNGLVRAIRSLDHTARVSLQCERRRLAPYGLQGGADGKPGHNYVVTKDGAIRDEPGKASLSLAPGEIVVVETPGGGGWGAP